MTKSELVTAQLVLGAVGLIGFGWLGYKYWNWMYGEQDTANLVTSSDTKKQ